MFDRIKDIIFKIKDYDRLEHDYSLCLCYFTNNRLSKTNYEIRGLETVICDTIWEYHEEGYKRAIEDVFKWMEEHLSEYVAGAGERNELKDALRDYIKAMI